MTDRHEWENGGGKEDIYSLVIILFNWTSVTGAQFSMHAFYNDDDPAIRMRFVCVHESVSAFSEDAGK